MNNVVDIRGYIKAKIWVTKRYNESVILHDRYASLPDAWSQRKAGYYADSMIQLGDMLDNVGGAI